MYITFNLREFSAKLAFSATLVAAVALAIFCMPSSDETVAVSSETAPIYPVLIIDAGHGGEDGGAVTDDGVRESGINLKVAQRLEGLAAFWGADTLMTRTVDEIDYPSELKTTRARKNYDQRSRVDLINAQPDAVLISIHQNRFPNPRPRGTQVFYASTQGSAELGAISHDNLIRVLNPDSRRVVAPIAETIYLMKQIDCPAVLVECGFLSNPDEARLLQEDEYQKKLALVMFASFLQYCDAM